MEEFKYTKVCPYCKKSFKTNARNQKFCCAEHGKLYNVRLKRDRLRYNSIKPIERLRARAHSLAVDVVNQLVVLGIRKNVCECCGSDKDLQVHHKNLVWFDNTPSNLQLLCKKCHAAAHSKLEKSLDERGILVDEFYEDSFKPFVKIVNKQC